MSFQRYIVLGNCTRDVEQKYLQSGTAVADFGIAVNEKRKDANGNVIEETMFIDCVAFGRTAEVAAEYLSKGSPVLLEGKLKFETWDDKQSGAKRSRHKILVDNLRLMPTGKTRNEGGRRDGPPDDNQREQPSDADCTF